jgi:hypothetical protein
MQPTTQGSARAMNSTTQGRERAMKRADTEPTARGLPPRRKRGFVLTTLSILLAGRQAEARNQAVRECRPGAGGGMAMSRSEIGPAEGRSSRSLAMAVAIALIMISGHAFAASSVSVDITAQKSTPGNIALDVPGSVAQYQYTLYDGQSLTDNIPVEICPTDQSGTWTSFDVSFGTAAGNLASKVTLPSAASFSASGTELPNCQTKTIEINTDPLTLTTPNVSQNFNANINLSTTNELPDKGPDKLNVALGGSKVIQIKVTVLPQVSNVSCFLTDSEGNFLNDCTGQMISESGSDDGRFVIVANKKNLEVATNPGQFYYNFIWYNTTGSTQTVNVSINRYSTVLPKGAQALHAAVFNGYLSYTPGVFDEAIAIGIPEGKDDKVSNVSVPEGSSLLVTYHLEWAGLGKAVPTGCATLCNFADQQIKVTATVSGTGVNTESCTTEAYGYKK